MAEQTIDIKLGPEISIPWDWDERISQVEGLMPPEGQPWVGHRHLANEIKEQLALLKGEVLAAQRARREGRESDAYQIETNAGHRLMLAENTGGLATGSLGVWDVYWGDSYFKRVPQMVALRRRLVGAIQFLNPAQPVGLAKDLHLQADDFHLLRDRGFLAMAYLMVGGVRMGELQLPANEVVSKILKHVPPKEIRESAKEKSLTDQVRILV